MDCVLSNFLSKAWILSEGAYNHYIGPFAYRPEYTFTQENTNGAFKGNRQYDKALRMLQSHMRPTYRFLAVSVEISFDTHNYQS